MLWSPLRFTLVFTFTCCFLYWGESTIQPPAGWSLLRSFEGCLRQERWLIIAFEGPIWASQFSLESPAGHWWISRKIYNYFSFITLKKKKRCKDWRLVHDHFIDLSLQDQPLQAPFMSLLYAFPSLRLWPAAKKTHTLYRLHPSFTTCLWKTSSLNHSCIQLLVMKKRFEFRVLKLPFKPPAVFDTSRRPDSMSFHNRRLEDDGPAFGNLDSDS